MYNGLGLRTPRGSGTNGYVQRNLSFAKPKLPHTNYQYDQEAPRPARRPNADVLLHRSKRQIEVECLLYEEELKDSGKYNIGRRHDPPLTPIMLGARLKRSRTRWRPFGSNN